MIISIISTLCGVLLLFNPFKAVAYFTKVVGIFIIVYSILDMISSYTIKRNVKQFHKKIEESIAEAEVLKEEVEDSEKNKETKKKKN